jgi:hypothetical protein
VYTNQGVMDGTGSTVTWAQSNTDPISLLMAKDYEAKSFAGQIGGLGSALLERFQTTGSNFSQSVTVGSGGATGATGTGLAGSSPQGNIELTVETKSGVKVDIQIESTDGTLGVSVTSSGQLSSADRSALAKLASGFQQAINGLSAYPPTLDLDGLTQYDSSVLSSVNLQYSDTGDVLSNMSADFSENSSTRSLSLTDAAGSMKLSVDTGNAAMMGSSAQRDQAIANYLQQFDNANQEGHGNTAMMALFKDAFTQLNSNVGTSQGLGGASGAASMLTGLGDFSGSITETGQIGAGPDPFSYQVSQTTSVSGNAGDGTITQQEQSHLKAAYVEALSSTAYNKYQIDDSESGTVKLTMEKGILSQALQSQSSSRTTTQSKYEDGKLVSETTTPDNTSESRDLLALLQKDIDPSAQGA